MGTHSSNIGQAVANALTDFKPRPEAPVGQPIETVLDQECDCHDDNGEGTKDH
jgi:hypothetical protein